MKAQIFTIAVVMLTLVSCSKTSNDSTNSTTNKVLVLKVDYTTNMFEGGKELTFADNVTNMTVSNLYVPAADFGSIRLMYQEINETLFDGTIVWNGLGQMTFPENLWSATLFERVDTEDYMTPVSGFENVFNPNNTTYDYLPAWTSVQSIVKVRQYLQSNPTAKVKLFLYTPSVGIGNPAEWDWIIIMKN